MLDGEKSLSDVRNVIHKLYTSLNVDRHQVIQHEPLLFPLLFLLFLTLGTLYPPLMVQSMVYIGLLYIKTLVRTTCLSTTAVEWGNFVSIIQTSLAV